MIPGNVQVDAVGLQGEGHLKQPPEVTQRLSLTPAGAAERIARDGGPVPRKGSGQTGAIRERVDHSENQ